MLTHGTLICLCRARDILRGVHDRHVSIDEVARHASMSTFQFIRQFQAVFGETPHQYRIRARLDRAKALLAHSDYSVTDVCMEVGFSSLGSFSDLFARRIGSPPSAYRRQIRTMIQVPGGAVHLAPGCLTLMGAAFAIFEKQSPPVSADAGSCASS